MVKRSRQLQQLQSKKDLKMLKTQLLAEVKRLETYLADQKANLPSSVFAQSKDCKVATGQLSDLNEELLKIEKVNAKDAAKEAQKVSESLDLLTDFKDRLAEIRDEIDATFTKLHHTHKPVIFEIKNVLAQVLRNHKS